MNIKSIVLIMDLSSLNRCMSVSTCSKCIFYDSYNIHCKVGILLKNNDFVDWYDRRVVGIMLDHCYQFAGCKKCMFKGKNIFDRCNRVSITKNVIKQKWRT